MTSQKQPRMFQSDPPARQHKPPRFINTAEALKNIQSYLRSAQTGPHLHPDAIFSEQQGPTFAGLASEGGLVLHQLRRVEAGLKGNILAADAEVTVLFNDTTGIVDSQEPSFVTSNEVRDKAAGGDDAALDAMIAAAQRQRLQELRDAGELPYEEHSEGANDSADMRDWADRSYNEQMLEQGEVGIMVGEIGTRNNVVSQEVPFPARKRKIEEVVGASSPVIDKDARKRAKMERKKEEKKAKEKSRQRKAVAGELLAPKTTDEDGHIVPGDATQKFAADEMLQTFQTRRAGDRNEGVKNQNNRAGSASTEVSSHAPYQHGSQPANSHANGFDMEKPDFDKAENGTSISEIPKRLKKGSADVKSSKSPSKKKPEVSQDNDSSTFRRKNPKSDPKLEQHCTETDASNFGATLIDNSTNDTIDMPSRKRTETSDERRARKVAERKSGVGSSRSGEEQSQQFAKARPKLNGEKSLSQNQNHGDTRDRKKRKEERRRRNQGSGLASSQDRQSISPKL